VGRGRVDAQVPGPVEDGKSSILRNVNNTSNV